MWITISESRIENVALFWSLMFPNERQFSLKMKPRKSIECSEFQRPAIDRWLISWQVAKDRELLFQENNTISEARAQTSELFQKADVLRWNVAICIVGVRSVRQRSTILGSKWALSGLFEFLLIFGGFHYVLTFFCRFVLMRLFRDNTRTVLNKRFRVSLPSVILADPSGNISYFNGFEKVASVGCDL